MIIAIPPKTQWDLNFSLFGIPVSIHPGFWVVAALLNSGSNDGLFLILGVFVLGVNILAHEFGHAVSSRVLGERRNRTVLYWMGGLCVHADLLQSHGRRIWTLLWGPLAGFILGGLAFAGMQGIYAGILPANLFLYFALHYSVWIGCVWGLTNLLPVYPLDGGQILHEFVQWKMPSKDAGFVYTVSMWTAGIVAVLAVLAFVFWRAYLGTALFFGALGYENYMRLQRFKNEGEEARRQPWEQNPDWWKK